MYKDWVKPNIENLLEGFDDCDWFGSKDGAVKLNPHGFVGP